MRNWINAGFVAGLTLLAGCSHPPSSRETVDVSGGVRTSAGEPVTGVRLILQSTTEGEAAATFEFDLDENGHFEGEAFPGRYAFFLATVEIERDHDESRPANRAEAEKLKKSQQVLQTYPVSYRTPRNIPADHHVEVVEGRALTLIVVKEGR
jgi:hypothetical protein